MQNRGALWVFTILLALACLWQLSFSFFTGRFERNAEQEAAFQADSVAQASGRTDLDMDSLSLVLTNKYLRDHADDKVFFGYSYGECKERELNLGLDLKGGMAVTLEVSIPELVDNLSDNSQDATFRQALQNARTAQRSDDRDFITLFAEAFRTLDPNAKLAAIFHSPDKATLFPREATDEEIVAALRREAEAAINNTEKILRTRIDKFGVAQPMIQKQQFSGRIQIELPGVKDKERVRKVLQSTANLEFYETFEIGQVLPSLAESNTKLASILHPELGSTSGFSHQLTTGVNIKGANDGVERKLVDLIIAGGPVDKKTWFDFDRVTFASNSAAVDTTASAAQLGNLVEVLKAYPDLRLKIGGYTDSTGNEEANKVLSQQRAEAVVAELVRRGADGGRLASEGYGSEHPVATNTTEEGRAKNRRMALRVTSLGGMQALEEEWDALATDDLTEDPLDSLAQRAEDIKKNPLFAVMQVNASQDGRMFFQEKDVVGLALPSDTSEINRLFRMAPPASPDASAGMRLLWSAKPVKLGSPEAQRDYLLLHAIKVPRGGKPKLNGTSIVDARQDFSLKGEAEVAMQMNAEGAQVWKVMTGDNVGKNVAIVLDNYVYSSPVVQGEIPGGRSSITLGGGDLQNQIDEANDLANILKAGALPAPARIIDETIVGASLGEDNIKQGMISFLVALVCVMLYMWLYYAGAGLLADMALVVNLFVLIGSLASLGAALTLPGIAGIVLTMGMAVDANVLIFERIREEMRHGKMLKSAVDLGYKGALSAIIDSNVTTLIVAVILYYFGSGPIKGFAITLGLGILTSLFTAIFLTRMVMSKRLENGKSISFWNNWSKDILVNANYDWMSKRKVLYGISFVIIGIGVMSIITRGFNLGVDFSGGRMYVVKFEQPMEADGIRGALEKSFLNEGGVNSTVNVKSYGGATSFKVTTNYLVDMATTEADAQVEGKLKEGLDSLGAKFSILESRKVDPTISDDIKSSAILSVIIALGFIFIYVAVRFSNWQYGLGGLLSLTHDALFVLGLYSLLNGIVPWSMEIDESFIAVILTVIGYSINDTVVVFDRIREYLGEHKRDSNVVVFNKAINATLGRTLNTSVTTLLVLLVIFLLGGMSIKGFVFGMFMGILVGTYSSIFIASAITVDLLKERKAASTTAPVAA